MTTQPATPAWPYSIADPVQAVHFALHSCPYTRPESCPRETEVRQTLSAYAIWLSARHGVTVSHISPSAGPESTQGGLNPAHATIASSDPANAAHSGAQPLDGRIRKALSVTVQPLTATTAAKRTQTDTSDAAQETRPIHATIHATCNNCHTQTNRRHIFADTTSLKQTLETGRARLREEGWTCTGTSDICPDCAGGQQAEPAEDARTVTVVTMKRYCPDGHLVGDVTEAEIEAAINGDPLPDVRLDCTVCRDTLHSGPASEGA